MSSNGKVRRFLGRLVAVLLVLALVVGSGGWYALFREVPQVLADDSIEEYFKYGSIGTENAEGLPYYVWLVLPRLFAEYLPKDADGTPRTGGYLAFGAAWEPGRETPVGFSKKTIGFPRIGINCALCHTATYRTAADAAPVIVPTGPTQRFDAQAYVRFLSKCASDPRFTADNLLYEIEYNVKLSFFDKLLYRYVIVPQTKKALLEQKRRYAWTDERPRWGPGRIDPFNPVKFHQLGLKDDKTIGNSDMMPIWNMTSRQGHPLHWDGLNSDLTEVVLSGAIGDGATNKSLPIDKLKKLERYLRTKKPPRFPYADNVDAQQVKQGRELFETYCATCHAAGEGRTGSVIPLNEIRTDPHRAQMWTQAAVDSYHRYSDGYPWDFEHFADLDGYVAVPLDGLWLRAPYLHNGSVPSLDALLRPADERPKHFYRGSDLYLPTKMGFAHGLDDPNAKHLGFEYDVDSRGNGNFGHEGKEYGTELSDDQRKALIEYLKTL